MELPKRDDDIYKEIENFEDYEYTNCLAYEMAIRNNGFVENIINDINKLNNSFLLSKPDPMSFTYYKIHTLLILREHGLRENRLYEIEKIKQLHGIAVIDFLLKNINCETNSVDELLSELKAGYEIKQHGVPQDYDDYDANPAPNNIITPNFARPYFKYKDGINVEFELNLALPKDELIAYISKIKDEYDEDNSIIKSPLELLGKDLVRADTKINKNKMADWFYVYDLYKIKKNQNPKMADTDIYSEIDLTLLKYYDSQKVNYYSERTYKNIKVKMTYLIENLGYKELISGISIKG